MHELSIAQSILQRVEALQHDHNAVGIEAVTLQVGSLSGVDPYALELAFEVAVEGTPFGDTKWTIQSVPAQVCCRACGSTTTPDGPFPICGACDSTEVEIVNGRELMIDTIRVKQDEEQNHV